jgi:hypothetical protein
MPRRERPAKDGQIRIDRLLQRRAGMAEPVERTRRVGVVERHHQLGAVAGGQQARLGHRRLQQQRAQLRFEPLRHDRHPLAHVERRGVVVDAQGE